jgi:flagellar motor switch/type III secretory pathway protein FliN
VSQTGVGRAVLVAGTAEAGIGAELLPDGRIVVGEQTLVALAAPESTVKSDAESPPALEQAVLEAPLVVRIELASVSLAAREWASLKAGDVIETRRRIGGPVVLRAGGQTLAHGELVNLEGELGVRVTRLLPPETP